MYRKEKSGKRATGVSSKLALLLGIIITLSILYFAPYVSPTLVSLYKKAFASSCQIAPRGGSCFEGAPPVPTTSRSMETFYDGNQVVVFKRVQPHTAHNWWDRYQWLIVLNHRHRAQVAFHFSSYLGNGYPEDNSSFAGNEVRMITIAVIVVHTHSI